jgi:hypothetical protein
MSQLLPICTTATCARADTLVFLAATVALVPIAKRLNISPVLGFLAAGVALGPNGFKVCIFSRLTPRLRCHHGDMLCAGKLDRSACGGRILFPSAAGACARHCRLCNCPCATVTRSFEKERQSSAVTRRMGPLCCAGYHVVQRFVISHVDMVAYAIIKPRYVVKDAATPF